MTNYTLSPVWGAGAQLLTNNATPLTGGKIYIYAAGTTTPVATYTDPTGAVPNTNPIILDAAGRPPNEIWFPVGSTFKFVLKTSTDVLIATYDNIPSVPQPPFTNSAGGISYSTPYLVSAGAFTVGVTYTIASVGSTDFTAIGAVANVVGVTFTASGAGSGTGSAYYTRPVQAKLQETISVKDFGAVGDGVANDTVAIQTALNSMVAGGTLLFPSGTYKVTTALNATFNNGAVVRISGYGAKIDGSSITGAVAGDTTLLRVGGARLSGVALGASVAKYANSLTTSPAITASVNDIALITSTQLWNPTRAAYYKGELIELQNISGTTLTPQMPLYDSYTAATTTVYALSMPTVVVEGLELVMNANQIALNVSYCRNPTIRNVKIHGSRYAGAYLTYCFGGSIEDCEVYDVWYSGTGTSYGVGIATCQNVVVKGNNLTEARHCITGGGWEPCREIIYTHNICTVHPSEPNDAAIDHHGNMEFCAVLNNIVNGGIVISSINSTVKNNIVFEHRSAVNAIQVYQEISADFYEITGNTVTTTASSSAGVRVSPGEASLNINRLIVHDNNVTSVGRALDVRPAANTLTGCTILYLSIKNNVFYTSGASTVCFYHGLTGAAAYSTTVYDSANNMYRSENWDAGYIQGNLTDVFSTNDKFYGNRPNGILVQIYGVNATILNPYFEGSISGGGAVSRSVQYFSTGTVKCINPNFQNLTYKAELDSPVLYIEQGWQNATPTILNTSGAKLVNFYGTLGRAITYGTAAPTTRTWAVGDRVYNQTPAVGQPKSWVCTVAGTPGTWVSEGNL